MAYTEEQEDAFKEQFASRRWKRILLAIGVMGLVLLGMSSREEESALGIPMGIANPVGAVLILAGVAFMLSKWRCPACNGYLGRAFNPKFCPKCGVELR